MKKCNKCGQIYEIESECPHIVVIDDNPVSIAMYMQEHPEIASKM